MIQNRMTWKCQAKEQGAGNLLWKNKQGSSEGDGGTTSLMRKGCSGKHRRRMSHRDRAKDSGTGNTPMTCDALSLRMFRRLKKRCPPPPLPLSSSPLWEIPICQERERV
ncbi:hypothetical protein SKAU_G00140500 [Synaphobranchus kaupii]|uniref:Uncharacterized protein n=1 Tax=Synaphobranchus kaupii TaxID=118154 RepID=A0A9Q1FSL0_SYNKA|nr:hypothetical protein SKAU_G00140500 [Synaphobranchus kaupii]